MDDASLPVAAGAGRTKPDETVPITVSLSAESTRPTSRIAAMSHQSGLPFQPVKHGM
jgi:hypothetical protein